MKMKSLLISSLCLLTALVGMQQPIFAAKRHKDSSSSSSSDCCDQQKKCCKKTLARLSQIDQTTVEDLLIDQQTLNIVNHINQTTQADLLVDQETLDVVNEINQTTQNDLAVDQNIERIVEQFDCVTVIDSLPYVISEPGTYKVACDLVFDPSFSPNSPNDPYPANQNAVQAAITITASNVHLDLGTSHISQFVPANPSEQVPYCIGILVPNPLPNDPNINAVGQKSVYITGDNAIISDFSMFGIRVFAHTQDIRIENVTIRDIGRLASKAIRPTVYGFEYQPHASFVPGFGAPFTVAGLCIGEVYNGENVLNTANGFGGLGPVFFSDSTTRKAPNRIKDLTLKNVSCLDSFVLGVIFTSISNIEIDNCHFDFTWSDDPGRTSSPAYVGLFPTNAIFGIGSGTAFDFVNQNAAISNCTFNSAQYPPPGTPGEFTDAIQGGPTFAPYGLLGTNNKDFNWNNCDCSGHSCTFPNTATNCCYLGGSNDGFTFTDCHFDSLYTIGGINGFHESGAMPGGNNESDKSLALIRCTFDGHKQLGTLRYPAPILSAGLTGCVLFYAKAPYLEDCTARNNIVYSPSNAGGSGLTCRGFQLTLQPGTNALPPVPDARLSDVVFKRCIASRNITTCGGSATGFNCAGNFPTTDSLKSLTFEDCIATGNQSLSPGLPPLWVAGTYALNDTVSFNNQNYISLIADNVNSPAAAPADWGITEANVQVWNVATAYTVNTAVTYNGVLYAAKTATTGNQPDTSPANWAKLAVNVSPWNSGTTYAIGDCVSYKGYNYYSLQNANLNNNPDGYSELWGLYPGRSISDRPAYGLKDWSPTIGYNTRSVVIAAGIIYVSKTGGTNPLAGTNIGNQPDLDVELVNWTPYNISLTGSVHQGGGFGFFINDKTSTTASPELADSQPTVFKRCLATHNKGLPVYNSTTTNPSTFNPVYSAGYYCVNDQRTAFIDCDAIDNIYGFFLKRCSQYTVRNCRSDNNVDLSYVLTNPGALAYVGEGYTDVGTYTGAVKSVAVANPGSGYLVGDILTLTTGSVTATVQVTAISGGGAISAVTLVTPGTNYVPGTVATTGGVGTGATISITAILGTPVSPNVSTSMFEGNSANNNGAGTAHVGPNGNYNMWVNAGGTIRPLLLECVNATSACVIDPTNNTGGIYFAGKHNLSTTNN